LEELYVIAHGRLGTRRGIDAGMSDGFGGCRGLKKTAALDADLRISRREKMADLTWPRTRRWNRSTTGSAGGPEPLWG
jgi:hypothetical protein